MNPDTTPEGFVVVGKISGVFGVRGWVKVYSYTDPPENLLDYTPWYFARADAPQVRKVVEGRVHGQGLVARLENCNDRDAAALLVNTQILVRREQLPQPEPGEFYWADLAGLRVVTTGGVELGQVDHLFETGSNDVLVVRGERERLIPYRRDEVVKSVDLGARLIVVDWDPDF